MSAGTIAEELPEGFQRSEFLLEKGFLDLVVHRAEMRETRHPRVASSARRSEPIPAPYDAAWRHPAN